MITISLHVYVKRIILKEVNMKLKYNVLIAMIIASFIAGGTLQAQLFSKNDDNQQNQPTTDSQTADNTATNTKSEGGFFRSDDWGDNGGTSDPGEDSPIGEGILILSFMSGGYALIKRNICKKKRI